MPSKKPRPQKPRPNRFVVPSVRVLYDGKAQPLPVPGAPYVRRDPPPLK